MGKREQKRRNGLKQQRGSVSEATHIEVSKRLEEFRAGEAEVLTFDPSLSKQERALVHELCRKMGLLSRSTGRGDRRCISVFKSKWKKELGANRKEEIAWLTFSETSKGVLQDLFMQYPPEDCELNEDSQRLGGKIVKKHGKQDTCFCKPPMSKKEIAKKVELLSYRMKEEAYLREVNKLRSKLPITSFKDVITSTLESHQVMLISGETGCGKTTQVPQFLLDHLWSKGEVCKIVCTQPRRISAISVAERISYERGEKVGNSVGYKIRLESKGGKHSSIMFCTNGVLLRVLIDVAAHLSSNKGANNSSQDAVLTMTHIIVDEIHERDRFADLMLAILRDMLPLWPNLRLILMSATIEAEKFSHYFGGCPVITVPGFTHPVKSFYLEDILEIVKFEDNHLNAANLHGCDGTGLTDSFRASLDEAIDLALSGEDFDPLLEILACDASSILYNYQHSLSGASPLMVLAGNGQLSDVCMLLSFGADCYLQDKNGMTALNYAEHENQDEVIDVLRKQMEENNMKNEEKQQLLEKYVSSVNPQQIDTILVEQLLKKICTDSSEGAILVFLPGWDDINQMRMRLLNSSFFKDLSKFLIISLHSMIPSVEQKKIFKRPKPGVRKIILSTNIAETAVTIDDVVYVIDCGRMKAKSYDPYNNVSTLQASWISKASARQREGRAGRCQPGFCYHLYSKTRAASFPDFQVPEIQRMPIEELCLQVKLLEPDCRVGDIIQKVLDPPVIETIHNAILVLQDIGAFTHDEQLTDLGAKLGSLPIHPSTSKMVLIAILMNCLDPVLTLACAMDYRDPFLLPMTTEEKKRAAATKLELASLYGHSDQLTIVAAFDCWRRAKARGKEAEFCAQYFISSATMNMLFNMRKQLEIELSRCGFIPDDSSCCSLNAHDSGILHAVLVAGMYPMVGRILPPLKNCQKAIVGTASGMKVRLHPHSSNFKLSYSKFSSSPLIVYDEITRGDGGMFIKNCTVISPHSLIFLASEMVVAPVDEVDDSDREEESGSEDDVKPERGASTCKRREELMSSPDMTVCVVVDRWLKFQCNALDIAQIYCLRERLSAAILFKVQHPGRLLPPSLTASVHALARVLSSDGLAGISQALELVDGCRTVNNVSEFLRSLMADGRRHCPPSSGNHRRPQVFSQRQSRPPRRRNVHSGRGRGSRTLAHGMGLDMVTLSVNGSFKRPRPSWSR